MIPTPVNGTPKFSVVIPVYNRKESLIHAINSVMGQTYRGCVQIVVVNDGSTDGVEELLGLHFGGEFQSIRYEKHEKNLGKTFARNTGLRATTGEWVCELDSDDEYHSHYLEAFDGLISKHPDINVFTCGAAVYNHRSGSFHTRPAFTPRRGEVFGSGKIGTGSFIYRRELVPYIPESPHPYGRGDSFSAMVQRQIPEIKDLYGQTSEGQWKPLGNPFGDDYVKFFMLTRKNAVIGTNLPLYLQNVRP